MSRYTITLRDGKYTVINTVGHGITVLRFGEHWPAGETMRFDNVAIALAERVQELEEAIKVVLDGTLDDQGRRYVDGLKHVRGMDTHHITRWEETLRKALEQKP